MFASNVSEVITFSAFRFSPARTGMSLFTIDNSNTWYLQAIANLMERIDNGGWVHIFAEGRVWQEVQDAVTLCLFSRSCDDRKQCI